MSAQAQSGVRLELRGVRKRYGSLQALDGVTADLCGGEVHALLGENGAGKTTLMNVLYGLTRADGGTVMLDGVEVRPRAPEEARRLGIGMVHQHFTVVDRLTTAENIALGLPARSPVYDPRAVAARALDLARRFGLDIGDPAARTGDLAVGQRQRIEILKALAVDARVLILDEPTAVLTPPEVDQLFAVLQRLRREGRLIVFITHKLGEVRRIADRLTVLRRGRVAGTGAPSSFSDADLARLMVGAAIEPAPAQHAAAGRELLRLDRARLRPDSPGVVDLTVRAGEIFGVAGVDGNGQSELFDVIAGLTRARAGAVRVRGEEIRDPTPARMLASGLGFIPPDRRADALVGSMSVADNLALHRGVLLGLSSHGILNRGAVRRFARAQVESYGIRTAAIDSPAGSLSGGNQQRLVIARALAARPQVLVAVNPARGLDIAAAQAVYRALNEFAAAGKGVLLLSTDLDEVLALSDRVGVLFRHQLSPALSRPFSRQHIGRMMAGLGAEG